MQVKSFTFNDFYENTYVVHDETLACIIVDPGCNSASEQKELVSYIRDFKLQPAYLVNTHCHIDHILGNRYINEQFNLPLTAHKNESATLASGIQTAQMFGIPYDESPSITQFIDQGDYIHFGNSRFEVLFTPGHSPASISLYAKESAVLICGDVLFEGSIGRTDLPGGNYELLINMIRYKFFTLPEDTVVYPGHGNPTTIGKEKTDNPFFR
jgi:glyoxylase-like metal-dependent hydrolase (beta-lactamase superfamily II)